MRLWIFLKCWQNKKILLIWWYTLLVILALILLVTIAIVKKCFSSVNLEKNKIHNHMIDEWDEWLSDCLDIYNERYFW